MSYTLHSADCLQVMREMPDNSVNLIATDPPYFKVKNEPWDRQWDKPEGFLLWLDEILAEFQRILVPNGSLYLFASPQMAARVECLIGQRFNVLNHIIWAKPAGRWNASSKESLRGFFPQTERVIFAEHYGADNIAKGEAGYAAKCDELRGFVFEPLRAYLSQERARAGFTTQQVDAEWQAQRGTKGCMAGHWFGNTQWALPTKKNYEWLRALLNRNGGEYLRREYEDLRREYEDLRREYEDLREEYEALRRPFQVSADVPYTDVWTFKTVQAYPGKHPCEKPLDMMEHIVKASSRPGDVVFDPFAGSGTTGIAAVRNGRSAILCEMSEKHCAEIRRRFDGEMNKPDQRDMWAA